MPIRPIPNRFPHEDYWPDQPDEEMVNPPETPYSMKEFDAMEALMFNSLQHMDKDKLFDFYMDQAPIHVRSHVDQQLLRVKRSGREPDFDELEDLIRDAMAKYMTQEYLIASKGI